MAAPLLDRLEQLKVDYGKEAANATEDSLRKALRARFSAPQDLIRLHEAALFFRAYPQNRSVLKLSEQILFHFGRRIPRPVPEAFEKLFEHSEVSGVAKTGLATTFSYPFARSLALRHGAAIKIGWDYYEHPERLAGPIAQVFPPAREDWAIAPHPDWQRWHEKYERAGGTLTQLITSTKPEVWDLLDVPLRWEMGDSDFSRTRSRLNRRTFFYHGAPLLQRRDISIAAEFAKAPLHPKKLSAPAADKILGVIIDASAVRYRELYGFLYPDAKRVFHVDLGRGTDLYFFGVPRKFRLPSREYCAGMYFKNGVPTGYVECMWQNGEMEVGFNLYYTFRNGETAWLYARLLKLFEERFGVHTFFLDPYQIGHENDEAIASGAFWFYYKMGFRPRSRPSAALAAKEAARIAAVPGYRSSPRILRQLARSRLFFSCA